MGQKIRLEGAHAELEIYIPSDSKDPYTSPFFLFKSKTLPKHLKLSVMQRIAQEVPYQLGSGMVYSIILFLNELVPNLFKSEIQAREVEMRKQDEVRKEREMRREKEREKEKQ